MLLPILDAIFGLMLPVPGVLDCVYLLCHTTLTHNDQKQLSHTTLTHNTHTQHSHTTLTYNTHTQHSHATLTRNTHTTLTQHSHTYTQHSHTYTQLSHSACFSSPQPPEGWLVLTPTLILTLMRSQRPLASQWTRSSA